MSEKWIVRVGDISPEWRTYFERLAAEDALRWEVHEWTGNDPDYCARCFVEWEDAGYVCEAADATTRGGQGW